MENITLILSIIAGCFVAYFVYCKFLLSVSVTAKNHCPKCAQNYGVRVKTPFRYKMAKYHVEDTHRTYRCLSCKAYFFVPRTKDEHLVTQER